MSLTCCSPDRNASTIWRRVGSARVSKVFNCTYVYICLYTYNVKGQMLAKKSEIQDFSLRLFLLPRSFLLARCRPLVSLKVQSVRNAEDDALGSLTVGLSSVARSVPRQGGAW